MAQLQVKLPGELIHVPPFWHVCVWHSSISLSHVTPVYPTAHWHAYPINISIDDNCHMHHTTVTCVIQLSHVLYNCHMCHTTVTCVILYKLTVWPYTTLCHVCHTIIKCDTYCPNVIHRALQLPEYVISTKVYWISEVVWRVLQKWDKSITLSQNNHLRIVFRCQS